MKCLNKKSGLNLILLESLSGFFNMAALIILSANASMLIAGKQSPLDSVTIRNDEYQFEVVVPINWSFRKIIQQDPYEEMKSGLYSSSISSDEKEPEGWNGFKLITTDTSDKNPQPLLIIYAHKAPEQSREEFAKLFKKSVSRFNGKGLNANWDFSVGDAKGFDCTYGLGAKVRYTALYGNETRVVIMYYFPSSDPADFDTYAPEVDAVIHSLRIE